MSITDSFGQSINSARVGDSLALRFEISDKNSPYDLFVRQLVALDGSDDNEIVLIDELGCPTDGTIMTSLTKVSSKTGSKAIETKFDAFKFPTSDAVLFKAVVSPCVGQCTPAHCYTTSSDGTHRQVFSFGKRRRRRSAGENDAVKDDDVVLSKFLTVEDTFPFESDNGDSDSENQISDMLIESKDGRSMDNLCYGPTSIIVTCLFFLFAQLLIIFCVTYICLIKRRKHRPSWSSMASSSSANYRINGNKFNYLDQGNNSSNLSTISCPNPLSMIAHGQVPQSAIHGNSNCGPNCPPRTHVHVMSKNGVPFVPAVGLGMAACAQELLGGDHRRTFSSSSSVVSTSSSPSALLVPSSFESSPSTKNRKNALISYSSKLGFDPKYYY